MVSSVAYPGSWTAPVDVTWLDADADHNEVAAAQVRGLVKRLADAHAADAASCGITRKPRIAFRSKGQRQ